MPIVAEAQERQGAEKVTVDKLYFMLKALERTVQAQQEEIRTLREIASVYQNPSASLSSSSVDQSTQHARGGSEDSPIQRNGSFKWATYPTRSPTKPDSSESPHPSPLRAEYDVSRSTPPVPTPPSSSQQTLVHPTSSGSSTTANTPGGRVDSGPPPRSGSRGENSSDNLKSFKVSLDDPTWKVLPAALKKYKINNDNWQNYAMFICYGAPNQRIERCLSYDEKPLLLFQKLKDGKKNPVFMLKHIKDIRSPIVVAQQKHAARKASNASSSILSPPATSPDQTRTVTNHNRVGSRPPRLEVHDLGGASLSLTGAGMPSAGPLTGQPQGWSDAVGSPSAEQGPSAAKGEVELLVPAIPGGSGMTPATGSTMANSSAGEGSMGPGGAALGTGSHARDTPITSSGVSYAVAIYPYMAEQEDEFDVMVGDSFVILSRARGWWVVQRDPNGTGQIDADTTKQGWVPAGCLLETNVPVASAIAEAKQALISEEGEPASPAHPRVGRTPILPLSIISTSFPGIALMDYQGKGDEELDLAKDDLLRVFKRYNHWSYVSFISLVSPAHCADFWLAGCQRRWWRPWMGPILVHR